MVFTVVFLCNLACAPYRIERDARLRLEAQLQAIEPAIKDIDWTPWQVRTRFTVREMGCILAGVEPSSKVTSGAAQAYTQEVIWGIQAKKMSLILNEIETALRRPSAAMGYVSVNKADMVSAKSFKQYLADRDDEPSRRALSNLDLEMSQKLLEGTATKTPLKIPHD